MRNVVITGATSGIGKELVKLFLKDNYHVTLVGRDLKNLKTEFLNSFPDSQWHFIETDLIKISEVDQLISTLNSNIDVHVLIHAAGIIELGAFEKSTVEWLEDMFKVNVLAPFQITSGLLQKIKNVKGTIVFINSTAGLDSWSGVGQYAATKHALRALGLSLRDEVEKDGVRVVNVYPGATDSPMQHKIQAIHGNDYDPKIFMNAAEVATTIFENLNKKTSYIPELLIKPWMKKQ